MIVQGPPADDRSYDPEDDTRTYHLSEVSKDGNTLTRICHFSWQSKGHAFFNESSRLVTGTSLERKMRQGTCTTFNRLTLWDIRWMLNVMRRHGFVERVRLVKIWSWKKPLRLKFFTKTLKNMPPLARPALEKRIPQNSLDIIKAFVGNVDSRADLLLRRSMDGKTNLTSEQVKKLEKIEQSMSLADLNVRKFVYSPAWAGAPGHDAY